MALPSELTLERAVLWLREDRRPFAFVGDWLGDLGVLGSEPVWVVGDLFQANLCLRLEGQIRGDPVELFSRALPGAQPRFGGVVDGVVSLSPERFLRREGAVVASEPIKGTRPCTGGEEERLAARTALIDSGKDAAEHVMIVDLMRNDLGRVCEYGSIRADLPRVEGHAGVWHLVSSISGRLRAGVGDGALLRASFPPGSVTGAPKVQAMKLIAALEASRREPLEASRRELYTGAVGILSPLAGLDLSVAIRTFEIGGGRIWLGVGGGITARAGGSVVRASGKVRSAPMAARGPAALASASSSSSSGSESESATIPPALRHGTRPDQALGVFETVLVQDGQPVELAHHARRLTRSLATLYGSRPPI